MGPPPRKRRRTTPTDNSRSNATPSETRPQRRGKSTYRRNVSSSQTINSDTIHVPDNAAVQPSVNQMPQAQPSLSETQMPQTQPVPQLQIPGNFNFDYDLFASAVIRQQGNQQINISTNNTRSSVTQENALTQSHTNNPYIFQAPQAQFQQNQAPTGRQVSTHQTINSSHGPHHIATENIDLNVNNSQPTANLFTQRPQQDPYGHQTQQHVPQQMVQQLQPQPPMSQQQTAPGHFPNTQSNYVQQPLTNIHNLVDQVFNTDTSATVTNAGRDMCHGPIIDLSGGIPLGAHVKQKVREQIWANDFIDLATLLPSQTPEEPWTVTVAPSSLTMTSKPVKAKGPLSYYDWIEAFHIYIVIYIEKYPQDMAHMLKYMSTIRDIYETRGAQAFQAYDQSFRLLRKSHMQPWQRPIDELYNKVMNPKKQSWNKKGYGSNNGTPRSPFLTNKDRDGTCHKFNGPQGCTRIPCTYKHVCKICRGPHSKLKCPRYNISTQQISSNQSVAPKPATAPNPNKK